jgi:UDP-N-acetylglucosamine acyltransferase
MIHPTAIISATASIDDDVEIGPYTIIGDNVEIGAGTRVDSHVVVNGPTRIGRDNHIYQFATISRGTTQDKGETVLGDDNWIMAYVHIAHDCVVGSKTIMANNVTLAGHVHVDDWVIFGGFSGAHQFSRVGAHAFLGMYAGVNRDVPAYTMVSGQPAVPKGINSEGLKRRDFSDEQIRNIKNAYRLVYRKGLKLIEAIDEIEQLSQTQPELVIFLESLRSSERGIIR